MSVSVWIDPSRGAAGDMILGACLDAGADLCRVRETLGRLDVEPIGLTLNRVRRHGMRASQAMVDVAAQSHHHRQLADVLKIIDRAELPASAAELARSAFRHLARAEARAHGSSIDEVHFHEVGALDAIADIVGAAMALFDLGALDQDARIVVGRVAVGEGVARAAHGEFSLPAPAVLELLRGTGAVLTSGGQRRELCTPTGAALLLAAATCWGALPTMSLRSVGVGAGSADPPDHANLLRIVIGDAIDESPVVRSETMIMVSAVVDDLEPRLVPVVLDELVKAGAIDAWSMGVAMRKGRPGFELTALTPRDALEQVTQAFWIHSTTLGVRIAPVERRSLPRDRIEGHVRELTVGVKRGIYRGEVVTSQPEFDDVVNAARNAALPVREALDEARRSADVSMMSTNTSRPPPHPPH